MITEEARSGILTDEEQDAINVGHGNNGVFPLIFSRHQVTAEEANAEGLDLWAARVTGFETAMESSYEHDFSKMIWLNTLAL
jgi:hypothetical protein